MDEWKEGKIGEELSSKLLEQLQADPVLALHMKNRQRKLGTLRKSND